MPEPVKPYHIICLSQIASKVDQVAKWHHEECLRQGLNSHFEQRKERLNKHLLQQEIPRTWVAVINSELCGCASLVSYQATSTKDLDVNSPLWLSNLYVPESFRCRGIGEALTETILSYAKSLSQREVWLMATQKVLFYQKRQWLLVRETQVAGRLVNVMRKTI